jgi:hypothetical protein
VVCRASPFATTKAAEVKKGILVICITIRMIAFGVNAPAAGAPVFSDNEVLLLLRAAIEREGGRTAFAKRHGIDRIYLNMVLSGRRSIGSTVVKALGLRKAYVGESMSTDRDNATSTSHPAPWSVEETAACFAVRDHNGQLVTCVYFEVEPGRRSVVTLFARDEARHIAAGVAKLPEYWGTKSAA